ncbi:MAG: hypothetical protein NTV08_06125 [Verrucomicrobia bacterium]|nr:hypothetical protein [Verrucomicrobiota bacterium]
MNLTSRFSFLATLAACFICFASPAAAQSETKPLGNREQQAAAEVQKDFADLRGLALAFRKAVKVFDDTFYRRKKAPPVAMLYENGMKVRSAYEILFQRFIAVREKIDRLITGFQGKPRVAKSFQNSLETLLKFGIAEQAVFNKISPRLPNPNPGGGNGNGAGSGEHVGDVTEVSPAKKTFYINGSLAKEGDPVHCRDIIETKDCSVTITMDTGDTYVINPKSKVQFQCKKPGVPELVVLVPPPLVDGKKVPAFTYTPPPGSGPDFPRPPFDPYNPQSPFSGGGSGGGNGTPQSPGALLGRTS